MTNELTLKPCPFCGNRADWNDHEGSTGAQYYVECVNEDGSFGCCKQFGGYARKVDAINAWNKRTGDLKADAAKSALPDAKSLWLWQINNGAFVAYDNPYPCKSIGGDPLVLGEPVATAIFKKSVDGRPLKRPM